MNDLDAFLTVIDRNPYDAAAKLALADWLEEYGETENEVGLAVVMRWCAFNKKHPGSQSLLGDFFWSQEDSGWAWNGPRGIDEKVCAVSRDLFLVLTEKAGWDARNSGVIYYSTMLQAFEALVGKVSLEK